MNIDIQFDTWYRNINIEKSYDKNSKLHLMFTENLCFGENKYKECF